MIWIKYISFKFAIELEFSLVSCWKLDRHRQFFGMNQKIVQSSSFPFPTLILPPGILLMIVDEGEQTLISICSLDLDRSQNHEALPSKFDFVCSKYWLHLAKLVIFFHILSQVIDTMRLLCHRVVNWCAWLCLQSYCSRVDLENISFAVVNEPVHLLILECHPC